MLSSRVSMAIDDQVVQHTNEDRIITSSAFCLYANLAGHSIPVLSKSFVGIYLNRYGNFFNSNIVKLAVRVQPYLFHNTFQGQQVITITMYPERPDLPICAGLGPVLSPHEVVTLGSPETQCALPHTCASRLKQKEVGSKNPYSMLKDESVADLPDLTKKRKKRMRHTDRVGYTPVPQVTISTSELRHEEPSLQEEHNSDEEANEYTGDLSDELVDNKDDTWGCFNSCIVL